MNITDILKNVNTYIGDTSTDRISAEDRYQAVTEGTAWLLEELGNEHMTDRTEIEFLPTVLWYKVDNLTPYLLTSGNLRFREEEGNRDDFQRVEARDLASMPANRYAYAIERYNGDSYVGILMPRNVGEHKDLVGFNVNDGYTYTGINAENIVGEKDFIRFDMETTGLTATGISTTTSGIDISSYNDDGVIICEVEIPDIEDVTSIAIKFGDDLSTDYYLGVVNQDVGGNAIVAGINTIKVKLSDITVVGTPSDTNITKWAVQINHDAAKQQIGGFRVSDLRVARPIQLTFKYIFYRVGKNASGDDIIEFTADTDVPFFIDRYPQYRYAVAHKAAAVLLRSLVLDDKARSEDREANNSLDRYRRNFSSDRDMPSSQFKVFGINLRGRRIIRRR